MPDATFSARAAQRGQQCPNRRPQTCGRIDIKLGWTDAIPMDLCDACWEAGPHTNQAHNIRGTYIADIVAKAKANIENRKPIVQLSIMGRFMSPEEAAAAKVRIDAAIAAKPVSKWEGEPYPKRIVAATVVAAKAFGRRMKFDPRCGCYKPLKKLVTGK